jgi:hypothetical protein
MDYQQKMLLVCGLLVAVALYFAFTSAQPAVPGSKEGEDLLMRAIAFGKGVPEYAYSYSEISDGYKNTYTLIKYGNDSFVELQNPLSNKKVYFAPENIILCLRYPVNETCGSVSRLSELDNYMSFFRSRFFNDNIIDRDKNNMRYMLDHNFVRLDPQVVPSSSNGRPCSKISYSLNLTNLSLDEAARFGIGSSSPREFDWTMCIDNETGIPYEKEFNYTYNGTLHTYQYKLVSYKGSASPLLAPNITLGETNGILGKLYKEREQQIKLASCYTDLQGEDRERCIAVIALDIERKDLCELSGARRDRCLVSLVPLLKDASICPGITNQSFKDDCYLELGGALKDNTYCGYISEAAKKETCMGISEPSKPKPPQNTTNSTSEFDPEEFMEYVDKHGQNNTNTTGPSDNSSG